MCLEQCLNCCLKDKWKILLLASMIGVAMTMVDVYSDIFVAIEFVYQDKIYWAIAMIAVIVLSNLFLTREVIMVMKPDSFTTVFCVAILSMLGFGPVVLLCYLFFDGDNRHSNFVASDYTIKEQSKLDPNSEAHSYFQRILSIRTHMAKVRCIEALCESMLSGSIQVTYLVLLDYDQISIKGNIMLFISMCISIASYGTGLTKWVRNYARVSAFQSQQDVYQKWYYNIFGSIYFSTDLAMRIIPFVLFYTWCMDSANNYNHKGHVILNASLAAWIIWEVASCRVAAKIWNNKYEISDSLMDPNSFLGGIFYCAICVFSSYFYMSQLPFNWVCGIIMLMRYIQNSACFIIFFMSIDYDIMHSQWTLVYLALYLLNVLTFLIWLFFKYHWLSILVPEKGGFRPDASEPLLKNSVHEQDNIKRRESQQPLPQKQYSNLWEKNDDHSASFHPFQQQDEGSQLRFQHNSMLNPALRPMGNNAYHPAIQMQSFPNSQQSFAQQIPVPPMMHMNYHQNYSQHSMRGAGGAGGFGQNSYSQQMMHPFGAAGGYNVAASPALSANSVHSAREFEDYQFAMQIQQEQLYRAAQSKRLAEKKGKRGAKNTDDDSSSEENLGSVRSEERANGGRNSQKKKKKQRSLHEGGPAVNAAYLKEMNRSQQSVASGVSQNSSNYSNDPAFVQMQQQALVLQQQQFLMKQQYDRMSARNSEFLRMNSNSSNPQSVHSHHNNQQQPQQQRPYIENDKVPNIVVDLQETEETESMYGISQKLHSDGRKHVGAPGHRVDNNSNAKSDSMLREGHVKNRQNEHGHNEDADDVTHVVDSFDIDFGYNFFVNNNKVLVENNNLQIRSTMYNQQCWYNMFGKIMTQKNVQYHWRVKVIELNAECPLLIGVVDTRFIKQFQKANSSNGNKEYFAKCARGYGINTDGNLQTNGENAGKYCDPLKKGDVVDVYFDMKQFALWFGINGNDFGVAYAVDANALYRFAVSLFGPSHCLQVVGCDVVCYTD